jgi:peptidoglycan/LPS O-acetylase OafA/YrhL
LSSAPQYSAPRRWLCRTGLIVGLPMALFLPWYYPAMLEDKTYCILFPLATAGVFTWVIGSAAIGFRGIVGKILVWKPVSYLGRISYGMYVYHSFVGWLVFRGAHALHRQLPGSVLVRFTILSALTIAVSAASWHLVEKPFNDLKRFFTYTPQAPGSEPRLAGAVAQ